MYSFVHNQRLSRWELSLTLHADFSTAQWLRVEDAKSGSLPGHLQDTVTQRRRCWVGLHSDILYIQKGFQLSCWANWFIEACRFVSLWATNPEVLFTVASHCRSWSCCDWLCSYRIPDSRTGGCSKFHHNSHQATLHQLTAYTAVWRMLGFKSQCCQVSGTTWDVHVCLL